MKSGSKDDWICHCWLFMNGHSLKDKHGFRRKKEEWNQIWYVPPGKLIWSYKWPDILSRTLVILSKSFVILSRSFAILSRALVILNRAWPWRTPVSSKLWPFVGKNRHRNVVIGHFLIFFGKFGLSFDEVFCTAVEDKGLRVSEVEQICVSSFSSRWELPVDEW